MYSITNISTTDIEINSLGITVLLNQSYTSERLKDANMLNNPEVSDLILNSVITVNNSDKMSSWNNKTSPQEEAQLAMGSAIQLITANEEAAKIIHATEHTNEWNAHALIHSKLRGVEFGMIKDVRPKGSHGGTSRKEYWNVRALSNIVHNDNSNITTVGDDFTLKPGIYHFSAAASSHGVDENILRLYNETTETIVCIGFSTQEDGEATITGIINSNGTDLFELQHYTEKEKDHYGLGKARNLPGCDEVYCTIDFLKIT